MRLVTIEEYKYNDKDSSIICPKVPINIKESIIYETQDSIIYIKPHICRADMETAMLVFNRCK